MPVSELVLVAIAMLSIVAFALLLAPSFVWARRRISSRGLQDKEATAQPMADPKGVSTEVTSRAVVVATNDGGDLPPAPDLPQAAPDPAIEDRVVRVVSWAFLMAVAVFAAASGVWPESLASIVILIAVTGEALLLLQDVLPRTPFKRAKGPLQALLALVFASSLVALTGGLES